MTAIIAEKPLCARLAILYDGAKSLLNQADAVAGRRQDDGWGVCCSGPGAKALLKKSPAPARLEKAGFIKAVRAAAGSNIVLAHLRDASGPKGPRSAPAGGRNNVHPFCADGLMFAHNGKLFISDEIKNSLGKYARFVKGTTDSEVLFWQVVKMMDAYGDAGLAVEMALDEINTVWLSCRGRYPRRDAPYSGLNVMLADRNNLRVFCLYPDKKDRGCLLTPGWEYGRIAWRGGAGAFTFSSEPLDDGKWNKLAYMQLAHASLSKGRLDLKIKTIVA